MNININKQTILSLLLLLCSNICVHPQMGNSDFCCPTVPCDIDREYPYKVCENDEQIIICTSVPNSCQGIIKVSLPIRVNCSASPQITITGAAPELGVGFILDHQNTINDLKTAANKWNCICGYDVNDDGGTTISARFSDNWDKFNDPYTDKSVYDNFNKCDPTSGIIYFNNTSEFLYSKPSESNPNQELPPYVNKKYRVFMNNELIINNNNWKEVNRLFEQWEGIGVFFSYEIYNLVDIAMRQLGEILGMGWNRECGCSNEMPIGYSNYAIMAPLWEGDIPVNLLGPYSYVGLGGAKEHPSGNCDKCMFQKLYCPDLDWDDLCSDAVYNYQPQTQKIYPNPGYNTVAFDFELPKYAESLKLSVMNPLGDVVLVPIENETFEQGEHSILINVDRLPNGVYYIIIEAGAYRTAQPFTVVR